MLFLIFSYSHLKPSDKSDTAHPSQHRRRRRTRSKSPSTPPITDQLRQQLALMKMGKLKEPLLADSLGIVRAKRNTTPTTVASASPLPFPRHSSDSALPNRPPTGGTPLSIGQERRSTGTASERQAAASLYKPAAASSSAAQPTNSPPKPKSNFIDSLISKLRSVDASDAASPTPATVRSPTLTALSSWRQSSSCASSADNTSDFLGFTPPSSAMALSAGQQQQQLEQLDMPGMLPTPHVPEQQRSAAGAFVSAALDTFLKENALADNDDDTKPEEDKPQPDATASQTPATVDADYDDGDDDKEKYSTSSTPPPKRTVSEEALVTAASQPPPLSAPVRPALHSERPRTVAEKRRQLQATGTGETADKLRTRQLDNESFVWRALRRRQQADAASFAETQSEYLAQLQDDRAPFRREFWTAAGWLATAEGR